MPKTWYDGYTDDFLNTEREAKAFKYWVEDNHPRNSDECEEDLLNAFRDTQCWIDECLDWLTEQGVPHARGKTIS